MDCPSSQSRTRTLRQRLHAYSLWAPYRGSGAKLVAFARMDTAPLGKALQALIGQGSTNLRLLAAPGGGVPIVADGKIIGAMGVSGDQDAQCAMVGRRC
jgi:Haem-degrading